MAPEENKRDIPIYMYAPAVWRDTYFAFELNVYSDLYALVERLEAHGYIFNGEDEGGFEFVRVSKDPNKPDATVKIFKFSYKRGGL